MAKLTRRSVVAGASAALLPTPSFAAEWPSYPITIVQGFPAGGTVDLVARILGDGLSKRLGQSVIIESKPGASGTTAAMLVARSAPDGHTLFAIPAGHVLVGATFKSLPYRTIDDFTPIGTTVEFPWILVVGAESPFLTVQDFINAGRSRAAPLLYGTPGSGSGPHLAIERLAKLTNMQVLHVPYRGSNQAVTDLVGGRIDFMMDPPGALIGFVKEKKLRALAVSSEKRFFSLPDTPTLQETGVSGYAVTGWQALLAPAGLPNAIKSRLNAELNQILQESAVVARLHSLGVAPRPSTPEALKAQMSRELLDWTTIISETKFERI